MLKFIWSAEPVLIMAVLEAAIALGTAFGLHLDGKQVGAIMALAAALLGVVKRQTMSSPRTVAKIKGEASRVASGPRMAGMTIACLLLASCGSQEPCSQADLEHGPLALIVAQCSAQRAAKCPDAAVDDDCPEVDAECDRLIDERCGAK